ncbi:MAG: AAA family ATPase [Bryobacterales bacterium]|nr:AAA family ATPase [Bryobacterales bacterium]MDE0625446.1 AAA family ATPase [Bryobacterales bacterium]
MARKLLPIGIQTFREIRERDCYYVDKTGFAVRLAEEGKHYFLSRPRRFGKSLFLDMLKELFAGSRDLFTGLQAHDPWDWSARHPVVRLDFSGGDFMVPGYLETSLMAQLGKAERRFGVEAIHDSGPERFAYLVETLHQQAGQRVAVLVDEYDKPILDALEEPGIARANRNYLRGLYSMVKFCDAHIRFCFLAGVSKFSKVSLFSGLNNLDDITLDPSYSSICGYTEDDLDTVFGPELEGLERERVRDWYNGYSWGGAERVYNPFDALLLFRKRKYKAWWFETGTPTFLVRTLAERRVHAATLEGALASEKLLGTFDVGRIATEALLFQTGYLTVAGVETEDGREFYRLGYPNREVRESLNESLLDYLTGYAWRPEEHRGPLRRILREGDFAGLEERIRALFAAIPHDWYRRNNIDRFEGHYASVMYAYFASLGQDVRAEDSGSRGRADLALRAGGRVYVFEFKVVERAGTGGAMAQLRERGYADKHRHLGVPVHLVGVEFSKRTRNVERFETELA